MPDLTAWSVRHGGGGADVDALLATGEHVLIDQRDTWGMDLSNRALADFRNAWARPMSALPYGKPWRSFLTAAATAGDAVLNVADASGYVVGQALQLRDAKVTGTGKTATTITGCTWAGGSGTYPITVTPVSQGEVGGWGTAVYPLDQAAELWAAGYRLEERAIAWINGSADGISMSVAPYYWSDDPGDPSWSLPPSPPSGGLGLGVIAAGPSVAIGAPPANRVAERGFALVDTGWTAWAASAPAKALLRAAVYCRMNSAGATDNGEFYGYQLRLRWVQP